MGKEKNKRLPFKQTFGNTVFALKIVSKVAPCFFFMYFFCTIVESIYEFLTGGFLLREIVNTAKSGNTQQLINSVIVIAVIMLLCHIFIQLYWQYLSCADNRKINAYIDKILFKKAAEVELACYENPEFYNKYVKAMDEAQNRTFGVLRTVDSLIAKIIAISANSWLLFMIDARLILFALFPLTLGLIRRLENIARHKQDVALKPLNRKVEYIRRSFYLGDYAKEMRLGGMPEVLLRDFSQNFRDISAVIKKYGFRRGVFGFLQRFGMDILTVMGATLYAVYMTMVVGAQNGGMTVGDCIVVIGSIGGISYSLIGLVQVFAEFGEHALYLEDVREFLRYSPKITDGEKSPQGGKIALNNVSFKYDGAEKYALKNVSFSWNVGERIALVGSNGSGKSTLVKLLLRLYDPTEGTLTLDGTNITDFKLSEYRDLYSTVLQDFKMFSLTVKENVLLRSEKTDDDKTVIAALKESGVYDRVLRTKNGIDTVLTREFDDHGENLSVGEQQKLSLARIFATDCPFVLLDEPSSALDPIAEYKMFENMIRATKGRSVIFISHRLSSAVLADKVIMMKNGEIAEIGTHSELMAKDGDYAAMFKRQAENYLGSEVTCNV